MLKPGWVLILMILITLACGPSRLDRDVSRLAAEFSAIPPDNPGAYQTLLEKYREKIPANHDGAELIRAKILIALGRYEAADKKIEGILSREPELEAEAWLTKTRILIYRGKHAVALKEFRSIENKLAAGKELSSVNLYFALYAPDAASRADYAQKVLTAGEENPDLYMVMAADARLAGDRSTARQLLNKALESSKDESGRGLVRAELAKLDMLGGEAPALEADRWLNGGFASLSPKNLKGKSVVLVFRAPWCQASQSLTGMLKEMNESNKAAGLTIIECMKLYGFFRDGGNSSGSRTMQPLSASQEVNLVRDFIQRRGMTWPVAISYEGYAQENFHVTALPTLFFIGEDGKIKDFETGAGNPGRIGQKIKQLMN